MSRHGRVESKGIASLVLGGVLIVILAAGIGTWLGARRKSVLSEGEQPKPLPVAATSTPASSTPEVEQAIFIPELYFYSSIQPGSDIEAVAGEVKLAAAAGVHRFILRLPFPWPERGLDMNAVLYPLDRIEQEDPDAEVFLSFSLNPPESWFANHPDALVTAELGVPAYPSIGSTEWKEECKRALTDLMRQLETSARGETIRGLVLGALEDNRWSQFRHDRSQANRLAFRAWLREVYADETVLRTAWGDESVTFDSVDIPAPTDTNDCTSVFFKIPSEQNQVDFLRYTAETTAGTIAEFAAHVRNTAQRQFLVYVPYGYSFELLANNTGHNALGVLLNGAVDGVMSPVSYEDRGLGGTGGFMGPVHSARYHSLSWVIVDDTRTGISRNRETGDVERLEGLRLEDVLRVQRRNYAAAMLNGLGLAWADMEGAGQLFEPRIWETVKGMREAYESIWNSQTAPRMGDFVTYPTPEKKVTLMVVVDEHSRFYQRCDVPLNAIILRQAVDAALRVGVPTEFCLLQDVLDGTAAPASVYLFLNEFHLREEDRERLKAVMIENSAAAVWLYAPGYLAEKASVENVAMTTGMKVKEFTRATRAGSTFQLSGGRYLKKNQQIGEPEQWSPLFYLELPQTKVLARYQESERPSIGIEFFEEGWASVFIAEPAVTDDLLREILVILEKYVLFRLGTERHSSTAYFGPGLVAVHASTDGNLPIYFNEAVDAVDVLNPDIGWLNKLYIPLASRMGDTDILQLTPAISDELPEEIPVEAAEEADDDQ